MFLRIKRHLMAEADQGGASGNSAAPAEPVAPANEPQAQGAPVITKEVADYIESQITTKVKAERDAIFAEARRTFTEKRNKPKDEPSTPAAAPQQLDASEERRVLRDFDRTISRLKLDDKISQQEYRTDDEGEIKFFVSPEGEWMVSCVKMVRLEDDPRSEWQSYWGSLTWGYY